MKIIATSSAPAAIGPYSQAIKTGNMIFMSGQLGVDPVTKKLAGETVELQARQVFKNITAVLSAAGADLSSVVKTTVFLKSMDDFAKMNEIYESNFGTHKPARSTIQVAKLPLDALIEIECVASVEE
jgi:2-iminobutanoate/2-iminopropanoate deaminase